MRDDDNDEALARRAADGDSGALDALLRNHTSLVHGVCRRILGNPDDALDATQEALLVDRPQDRIVRRPVEVLDLGVPRRHERRARRGAAPQAAPDADRDRRRRPAATAGRRTTRPPKPASPTASTSTPPSRNLTPDYRAAVALRDLVGMDYAEISEVLGIPPGTVRSRISRGRAALADLLGNRETPSEHPTP